MRVVCPHCGGRATITSRQTHTPTAADLYCQCRNTMGCGATFVYTLALKHTLNPPVGVTAQLAVAVLKALPAGERAKLSDFWED